MLYENPTDNCVFWWRNLSKSHSTCRLIFLSNYKEHQICNAAYVIICYISSDSLENILNVSKEEKLHDVCKSTLFYINKNWIEE